MTSCRCLFYLLLSAVLPVFPVDVCNAEITRDNLLTYAGADGAAVPVHSPTDWNVRREAILRAAEEIMGPLPGAEKFCPLDVQTIEESDCGSYVRRLISYASEPGSRVPAYLLVPKMVLS